MEYARAAINLIVFECSLCADKYDLPLCGQFLQNRNSPMHHANVAAGF
jgi:hypothetical protein